MVEGLLPSRTDYYTKGRRDKRFPVLPVPRDSPCVRPLGRHRYYWQHLSLSENRRQVGGIAGVLYHQPPLSSAGDRPALRSHGSIENSPHHVLDVTFTEDASRIRKGKEARSYFRVSQTIPCRPRMRCFLVGEFLRDYESCSGGIGTFCRDADRGMVADRIDGGRAASGSTSWELGTR